MRSLSLFCFSVGLFCVLSTRVGASVQKTETAKKIQFRISIDQFIKKEVEIEGKKFTQTILLGISPFEGAVRDEGRPEIPVVRLFVSGDGEIEISASPSEHIRQRSPYPFLLAGKSVPKNRGARRSIPQPVAPGIEDYARKSVDYDIIRVGVQRGVTRRLVTLYPVQWDPQTGAETQVKHFTVSVPNYKESALAHRYYGVIVPEGFRESEELGNWIRAKKNLGFEMLVHYSKSESPEEIRSVIQDWYRQSFYNTGGSVPSATGEGKQPGLKAVLLLGDHEWIPSYRTELIQGFTDHYYAALDGGYTEDLAASDIQIGRLPVHDIKGVNSIMNRLIQYDSWEAIQQPWLKQASLIATDDPSFWKITEESLLQVLTSHLMPMGFWGSFPVESSPGGDRLFAVTHKADSGHLKSKVAEGRSLIIYSGHGTPIEWEKPRLMAREIADLNLNGALPFVFGFSCQTGRFSEHSIAEAWVEREAGAVSSVGSFADTYWDEDFLFQRALMDQLLGHGTSIGEALERGLEDVWRFYGGKNFSNYYLETYNIFADPSLKFRGKR